MGNQQKVKKPHETESPLKEFLNKKTSVQSLQEDTSFVASFRYFDVNQGSSFKDWQDEGVLAHAIEAIHGYSHRPLLEQCNGTKMAIYGNFPPNSGFYHPSFVPEDANWARIHLTGRYIIAGHVFNNTFYVVFLDSNHKFWIQDK